MRKELKHTVICMSGCEVLFIICVVPYAMHHSTLLYIRLFVSRTWVLVRTVDLGMDFFHFVVAYIVLVSSLEIWQSGLFNQEVWDF